MASPTRTVVVVAAVLLLHAAGLWVLQAGLQRRSTELLVPVQLLAERVAPTRPLVRPAPTAAPTPGAPTRSVVVPAPRAVPTPAAPTRVAVHPPPKVVPTPAAPTKPSQTTASAAPKPITAAPPVAPAVPNSQSAPARLEPVPEPATASGTQASQSTVRAAEPLLDASDAPGPAASPVAPIQQRIELPSSDAQYLVNPAPPYPPISARRGEQGTVLIRVLVSADGRVAKAEIQTSSGFDRLDRAALSAVSSWRFVPGRRGGIPESMWVTVPVKFVF